MQEGLSSLINKSIYICVTNDLATDQRMQRIGSSLAKLGSNVTLVGRLLPNSKDISISTITTLRLQCHYHTGPRFYAEYNYKLYHLLAHNQPDIVYCCDPDTLLAGGLYLVKYKKQGIYDSHEFFVETPELQHRPFVKGIWSLIEKKFAPKMKLHLTVNELLVQKLSERLHCDFHSIRNLPHMIECKSDASMNEKILLYQGVINKGRCIKVLIDTMIHLPDYQVWIAGEGDEKQQLESYTSTLPFNSRIKWLGKLSPNDLKSTTAKARYGFNLLDQSSANYQYSLANKFFDYMAHGVPSINSDLPMYNTYCNKYQCGVILHNNTPNTLAKTILELDQNPSKYLSLSINALNSHKTLNWEIEERSLAQLLNSFDW